MKEKNALFRQRLQLTIVLFAGMVLLQACTGTREVGILADALDKSTAPMAQRVSTLKSQHTGLATSYNQLRSLTVLSYNFLQTQICAAAASDVKASLYQAEARAHVALSADFDTAFESIVPSITESLEPVQAEIDRQQSLVPARSPGISSASLPDQIARTVFASLVQQRDSLRLQYVFRMRDGLQEVYEDAGEQLASDVATQIREINALESRCGESSLIRQQLESGIGPDVLAPEAQYQVLEAYLVQISSASSALKLYAETNTLFGSNGLMRLLATSAVTAMTGVTQAGQPSGQSSSKGNPASTDLAASVAGAIRDSDTTFAEPRAFIEDFTAATGLDETPQLFDAVVDSLAAEAGQNAIAAIEAVKSEASSEAVN